MNKIARVVVGTILITFVASSCGNPPGRSGASSDPVTLSSVYGQGPSGIGGDVVDALVRGTEGEAVSVAAPESLPSSSVDEETRAIKAVSDGDVDITVVRSGALQGAGAESLAPLTAPFVVTNNEQAQAIAQDEDLTAGLMSDLADLGLVGLALVPGGLRHPFGYGDEPLLGASDYVGQRINVRPDAGVAAILQALGATADTSMGAERIELASSSDLRGIEVSVQQAQAVDLPAIQTANVTLYSKFDVVVMNAKTWDGLTESQQEELRRDALLSGDEVASARFTESGGQVSWCEKSGAVTVLANEEELSSLGSALSPVTAALETDATMARQLEQMRKLGEGTSDFVPAACVGKSPGTRDEFLVPPTGDQTVLDGTWRLEVDEQEMLDAGVDAYDSAINAGVWDFRIRDGLAVISQPTGGACQGQLQFSGEQVSWEWGVNGADECGGLSLGAYRIEGDKVLFDWVKSYEYDVLLDQAFFARGMTRVGDG